MHFFLTVVGWIGSPKALGDISYSIWSDFGRRSTGNCIWHYLGCFWIVRREREREREKYPRFLRSTDVLSSVQQAPLPHARSFLDYKAAAAAPPPSHGEKGGKPGGVCCYMFLCAPAIPTLPINDVCSTPQFPEYTGQIQQRWHSETTAIVSIPVLFIPLCLLPFSHSTRVLPPEKSWILCNGGITDQRS